MKNEKRTRSLRLDNNLWQKLGYVAKKYEWSINHLCTHILTQFIELSDEKPIKKGSRD